MSIVFVNLYNYHFYILSYIVHRSLDYLVKFFSFDDVNHH